MMTTHLGSSFSVGCFALNTPFSPLPIHLPQIRDWDFKSADVTVNSDGACLGAEFGFTGLARLDWKPFELQSLFDDDGLGSSAYCAHVCVFDLAAPWRYGTSPILKAIRASAAMGIKHAITTEGEGHSQCGSDLDPDEALLRIREKR